ncbi:hypothetical protein IGI04_029567 [Brassica rapa subsp. trilocularis]|uniref:RRM domain-containing protein n=1 Tax=Brassica rapa subsp. trilocularis TaxID=1813537 RepID=A0ABQ7LS59_BRACM|nr:hypothetical protein IGI04_029567 [Brassica rapa subsp. trilocularis]
MQTTNNGPDSLSAGTTPPPLQQPTPPPPQQHWQNQQQWMAAMQYPMAMMQQQQHMMMYPHQYAPYSQGHYQHPPQFHYAPYHQQQHQQRGGSGGDDVKTLWVGDLLHWMDETYLHTCFSHTNEVSSVKVIRNKQTNQSEGYGFVEFLSRSAAEEVLQSYSGVTMPNADQPFRLNWASFSTGEKRASENGGPDLSIFVGDLAPDVTDALLLETFAGYQSVKGAKVVIDSNTGRSKGYGFVRFGDESERSRALTEMNGAFCSSRQMRVGIATPKRASAYGQQNGSQALTLAGGHGANGSAKSAEEAIENLNGTVIGKNTVRLSWGRSPNRQWRGEAGHQWNGGYSRGQGYSNGYANQDSNMYATAAAAVPGAS